MNFRPIFYVNGFLLLIMSGAMLFPALVDFTNGNADWQVFAGAQIIMSFIGFAMIFANRERDFRMTLRETFVLAPVSYIFLAAFGALPFCFSELDLAYTKAFFEAMSGLTTTGSTAITGLDSLPPGILLWRSMLQWLGGAGFLVIAMAVLPLLQVSGMQIFKSHAFAAEVEKFLPSAGQTIIYTSILYAFLTLICAALYGWAGMTHFEAVCHAMATLSTGGFSTSDASIAHFHSALIEWIAIVFMILGSLPFLTYLRALRGSPGALFADSQVRAMLAILGAMSVAMTAYLFYTGQQTFGAAFRNSVFMVTSLLTTTGFSTGDYAHWGSFAAGLAFFATFLGACSGSTCGGLKTFRVQILWLTMRQQLRRLVTPHGVFPVQYSDKTVEPGVQTAVAGFFFIYVLLWFLISLALEATGLGFVTSISAAITSMSNTGPGFGDIIGPAGNFSTLPSASLWVLSAAMLLGRMEFVTVLVLLMPRFWRD